jgi:uncharacterized protein YjbI with pentapeptide repeats
MKRILFFLVAFIIVIAVIAKLDASFNPELGDILVEFHGMLFDILFFGVILSIYEFYLQKRDKLSNYLDELVDFQGWNEPEAMYRNVGIIKRILRLKKNKPLEIRRNFLREARLLGMKFTNTFFSKVNMSDGKIQFSLFDKCRFKTVNGVGLEFQNSIFENCDFDRSVFTHSFYISESHHLTETGDFHEYLPQLQSLKFKSSQISDCFFNFLWLQNEILFENTDLLKVSFLPVIPASEDSKINFKNCKIQEVYAWEKQRDHFDIDESNTGKITFIGDDGASNKLQEDYVFFKTLRIIRSDSDLSIIRWFDFKENDDRVMEFSKQLKAFFKDHSF